MSANRDVGRVSVAIGLQGNALGDRKLDRIDLGDPRPHPSLEIPYTSRRGAVADRNGVASAMHGNFDAADGRLPISRADAFLYPGSFSEHPERP